MTEEEMLIEVKEFIEMYEDTVIGNSAKNMLENGTQIDFIYDYIQ